MAPYLTQIFSQMMILYQIVLATDAGLSFLLSYCLLLSWTYQSVSFKSSVKVSFVMSSSCKTSIHCDESYGGLAFAA